MGQEEEEEEEGEGGHAGLPAASQPEEHSIKSESREGLFGLPLESSCKLWTWWHDFEPIASRRGAPSPSCHG